MKTPKWLQWQSRKKSSNPKSDAIKNIRHRTDQKMKQQNAQKAQRDEAARKDADGVHRDRRSRSASARNAVSRRRSD
jgi:hypothetical protein